MALIKINQPQEQIDFKYNVNSTEDGDAGYDTSPTDLLVYFNLSDNNVSYPDANTKTNTFSSAAKTDHNEVRGSFSIVVTNNLATETGVLYYKITSTGSGFSIVGYTLGTETIIGTTGIISGQATANIGPLQVLHTGTSKDDTMNFKLEIFELIDSQYVPVTTTSTGVLSVSISVADLVISTVANTTGLSEIDGKKVVKKGESFSYDVTILNDGNAIASSNQLTLTVDPGLTIGTIKGTTNPDFTTGTVDITGTGNVYDIEDISQGTHYYIRIPVSVPA